MPTSSERINPKGANHNCRRRHFDIYFWRFSEKKGLTFHVNRQLADYSYEKPSLTFSEKKVIMKKSFAAIC